MARQNSAFAKPRAVQMLSEVYKTITMVIKTAALTFSVSCQ
jgi:hypothetical protein